MNLKRKETKREGLKVLTAPDDVEVVIKHVCENSEGTLRESDFDDRLKCFGFASERRLRKAANEFASSRRIRIRKRLRIKERFIWGLSGRFQTRVGRKKRRRIAWKKREEEEEEGGESQVFFFFFVSTSAVRMAAAVETMEKNHLVDRSI